MTQAQFIALLCVYVIVVVLTFVADRFTQVPEHVVSAKPNRQEILGRKSKLYIGVFTIVNALVIGCGVVAVIGMFFFWHIAPWLFAGSVAARIFLFATLFWKVRSGLEDMLNEIELLLDGVILTLVFFGPARHLFFL